MTTRRFYANNAPTLQLAAPLTPGGTSCSITGVFTGYPTQFPFFAEIDYGTASAEIVSVTNILSATATIVRGQGGTAAISHTTGATFDFVAVAQDFDEANLHAVATGGVHGVTGSVVGTTDTQTLTNKTLASPVVTGTLTGVGATLSGALSAASSSLSGNQTVGGTAAITGASTAASYSANGNGAVSGVVVPKTYTNEAAATAAIGSPPTGAVVYLTAPTTSGAVAGLFVFTGAAWTGLAAGALSARVGARATTNAVQALAAGTPTALTNGGTLAWTATEDSGGFVSAVGGTTTPITIPAGKAGLYVVGFHYLQSATSGTQMFVGTRINGTFGNIFSGYNNNSANGSIALALNAGDTLGMESDTATACNASVGCEIYCYRISN